MRQAYELAICRHPRECAHTATFRRQATGLVTDAARESGTASPLTDACRELFAEAEDLGHGAEDMAAIVRAIEARTSAR